METEKQHSLSLPSTQDVLAALRPGQRYSQPMPPGSGDACLIADLARQHKAPILVLCADPLTAQRLAEEILLFGPALRVRQLPDWETLPYDSFSPHQDLISERLRTLHALTMHEVDVLTVPVTTALYRLAPPSFLAAYTFSFRQGDELDEAQLRAQLMLANYTHMTQVSAPGEFSIRGGLIDLFPMGSVLPYRLDLFDNEIESIRSFDIDTQRSLYPVKEIQLLPGREFPMDEEARTQFRARFREFFEGDPSRALPYKDVGNGIAFAGIEYYLPLFFEETATLMDYVPQGSLVITHGDAQNAIGRFQSDTHSRFSFLKNDRERPILPPESLFLSDEQFFNGIKPFSRLSLSAQADNQPIAHPDFEPLPVVAVNRRDKDPLAQLRQEVLDPKNRTVLCADSAGRRETLLQMLREHDLSPATDCQSLADFLESDAAFALVVAPLSRGFALVHDSLSLLTENDLYPTQTRTQSSRRRNERSSDVEAMVRDLSELREGDPVVHAEHGIGRYCGLKEMDLGEGPVEFLHLEYAKGSTLYVPVAQLHVIARYSGADPEHAPLHQLGSGQWDKARRRAAKQARDSAAELLALYAQRAAREGFKFKLPLNDYQAFSEGFGFEETPDQAAAIEAVVNDMTSGQPMDRLVCGDVGFGKTEVALRAAFLAVANGKQVALLCPTTLLAEQHAQTFSDRFADWPIRVAELSRFRSTKETQAAIAGLRDGSVDIVIGTHKILSSDVRFKQLGLVIIDEEHRFGVRQKEALKQLRAEVDILTLTATPIPRTLGMSLEGIRDFSVIATAPQKRLAIKTFVRREDGSTIREALLRELKRGGQVYFLHNEVETIHNRRARLEELVPEASIAVAHGQMPERELEAVMKGFYQKRYNVLLCTTIIETGIDVPTANTIVIHRADRLGLAQLHQLRGRVGRSHHQAYAYLLTPGEDAITSNAKKRLEAIQAMEELGAGFFLAMHDLEIRGAGEVLGESQSGDIQEVGYSMYADMLNTAVKALKAGEEPDLDSPFALQCEVNLHTSALLPANYCPDVNARLGHYKALSHARTEDDLIHIHEELIDRYGLLPEAGENLLAVHRLRIKAEPLGIVKIDASEAQATIQFSSKPNVDAVSIIELVQKNKQVRLAGPDKLKVEITKGEEIKNRIQAVRNVLNSLRKEK
ncbi:transcription-repair coupling factor [Alcaligenes nematophilus]|uniref:transcription-repair coupling factor n=1 Tax=Alcaligenes TaxID=507 RepID=UPI0003964702|nr:MULTISPECIES: transcription-repair coupling factor [Alcaligenes]ERI33544.1 transcription-repair coupling factor [Alcaligenes sp. EGD-AK7]QRF89886.1 transcription-repair coupling factor [Alcaligenes faecalis]URW84680.1 transcription-repair coupling factor [Alcaligenes sp. DN25]UTM03839.1 transcription-repair coupling factor [Alcaligenes sp. NLF5-7]UUO13012.1 transcription-repair coupling factor [Alcaligenes faecalis]